MSRRSMAIITGALAGVINGFLGAGAGLLLVPLYKNWLGLKPRCALATSVATVAPMCALSAILYFARGQLPLGTAWPYLAGGLGGGFIGSMLFEKIPTKWLSLALGAFLLYGGLRMLEVF